ncbi:MAG: aspartate racemase [Janthinobacterium sp.]|jgi:aspartate racemase
MHIGMIAGIGPSATDYYYRYLIAKMAKENCDLQLTMAHADTPTLLRHQQENNHAAQVAIYLELTERLQRCGIERIAITSIAGHFCIESFKKVSPVPVIDLLDCVKSEVQRRGFKKLGLLGTRVVMESHFYGVLDGVNVIAPSAQLLEVHDAYIAMAIAGRATEKQREVFVRAGHALIKEHGCEAVMLAGTDLALVFNQAFEPGFRLLDCAKVHAAAIAQSALQC